MSEPPALRVLKTFEASSIIYIGITLITGLVLLSFGSVRRTKPSNTVAGCRKLGISGARSNLIDQYDSQHSGRKTSDESGGGSIRVKALFIYPIKSCYPVELEHSEVVRTGMAYDRHFTFARSVPSTAAGPAANSRGEAGLEGVREWRFITQRECPRLTRVKTELWVPDPDSASYSPEAEYVRSGGCIVVSFPYLLPLSWSWKGAVNAGAMLLATLWRLLTGTEPMDSFRLPFRPTEDRIKEKDYPTETVVIWKERPEALNVRAEIPEQVLARLKEFLGVKDPLTLFRADVERHREVFRCAPRKDLVGYQPVIGFADAYPLHLLNLAGVHDVASRLPGLDRKLDALRFRANIYVTGAPAFAEDHWARIRIGCHEYHVSCRTARCKLPNVDPITGFADRNQPYSAMSAYRRIDEGVPKHPCLGMQLVPMSAGSADIRVGDEIEVLETGEHFYIKQ